MAQVARLARAEDLDTNRVSQAYDRWAPIYDFVFGAVFEKGRRAAISAANRVGGRLLEVGVGTGISLPDYGVKVSIVGVDISAEMLRKAAQRVSELRLWNVEELKVMDGTSLTFDDQSFDVVMAQYVVTAAQDPEALLTEFVRVLKPGGEIILLSRVGADAGVRRVVERMLARPAQKLGWRTEFPWMRYAQWLEQVGNVELLERRPIPPLGHFCLIRFRKNSGVSGKFPEDGQKAAPSKL